MFCKSSCFFASKCCQGCCQKHENGWRTRVEKRTKQGQKPFLTIASSLCVVEMGESRTPRPNKPIEEYTTGLVDAFSVRFGLPSTGFVSAGPLVLDDD